MRDTTAKPATLRGGTITAGDVGPRTPSHCADCGIRMVPQQRRRTDLPEDCGVHQGRGFCVPCYYRRRYRKQWDGPAPEVKPRWKAADLVAEWEFLRVHRGCDRETAAKLLGVKPSTLTTAACRAKQYAERDAKRDALRAEIAAAEVEAHQINDDMNAYAARKQVAA